MTTKTKSHLKLETCSRKKLTANTFFHRPPPGLNSLLHANAIYVTTQEWNVQHSAIFLKYQFFFLIMASIGPIPLKQCFFSAYWHRKDFWPGKFNISKALLPNCCEDQSLKNIAFSFYRFFVSEKWKFWIWSVLNFYFYPWRELLPLTLKKRLIRETA